MPLDLQDDQWCLVCGKENPRGLRLSFDHPEKGLLKSSFVFSKEHQGYQGIVHGGMISAVLDEMMINLAWIEDMPAVTAEISVRLKKPTKVGERVYFEGRIDRQTEKVLFASALARNEAGETLATAVASCVRVRRRPCVQNA